MSSKGKPPRELYGILASIGYNGQVPNESQGRYRPLYHVRKRKTANGLKPHREFERSSDITKKVVGENYTVTYCAENGFGTVIEYKHTSKNDMFQIGRSTEPVIDYIVVDTIPGSKDDINKKLAQSTISRFACRIIVERSTPNRARICAAAFDTNKSIILGPNAAQWSNGKKFSDGLTTNGVLVNHPKGHWGTEMTAGVWREVSIGGDMFGMRVMRSAQQRGRSVNCTSILQDGTMIDLCGVVLLWRTPAGIAKAPNLDDLHLKRELLNALRAQCPVGMFTLRFSNPNKTNSLENSPYVYSKCGHVHGYHTWGARPSIVTDEKLSDKRVCPFCKESGSYISLSFGMEPLVYVDNGPATHAFLPCGHITTEASVKYWSSVTLPHGKDQFHAACPFCAIPLEGTHGYVKLIFQTQIDTKKEVLL